MKKFLGCFLLFSVFIANAQLVTPLKGMRITKTVKFRQGNFSLPAPSEPVKPVILIEGNNITVDFNNSTLIGNLKSQTPDQFAGIAILVRNSNKVTIRNLKARGYKIALMARDVKELILENCDLSYNY